ncbi:PEP-CTERM sorting domain-containing protein [bacterium]|nr:PEP-CTERM sorting domain-containing protein [bacterium]
MQSHPKRIFSAAVLLAVSLVASGSVFAASATYEWTGSSGIYSNDTLWTPGGGPPTNTDIAVFGTTGSYTVTLDRNETNNYLYVTNSNTVRLDLGGNTYRINSPTTVNRIFLNSNSTDTATLIVENGTLDADFNPSRVTMLMNQGGSQGSLIITNGGKLLLNYLLGTAAGATGEVVVTGAGSYLYAEVAVQLNGSPNDMPLIVRDGAGARLGSPYLEKLEVIGATVTNAGTNRLIFNNLANDNGYVRVIDGGSLVFANPSSVDLAALAYAGTATVTVGDGSGPGTSTVYVTSGAANLNINNQGHTAPLTEMTIGSDGLVRYAATGQVAINQRGTLTIDNGQMELTNSTRVLVNTFNNPAHVAGVLRGRGTLSVVGDGTQNFSLDNYGVIRPGDLSATPAIGTLTLNNGDLYQTNSALALSSRMYFEFDETSNDLLQLNSGLALVTAGTNTFALASGAGIPLPGVKYGKGTYDFLIATNLTWSPAYDNMTNLLSGTYGLAYGTDYQYGIVQIGADQFALRLAFVPEPSTILLLLGGGGLVLWARRRR